MNDCGDEWITPNRTSICNEPADDHDPIWHKQHLEVYSNGHRSGALMDAWPVDLTGWHLIEGPPIPDGLFTR